MKLTQRSRILITAVVTLLVWSHIAWDYFHEGIPVHYLLHNADLPGIPNWLGAIVLPFFTWFLLFSKVHQCQRQDVFITIRINAWLRITK